MPAFVRWQTWPSNCLRACDLFDGARARTSIYGGPEVSSECTDTCHARPRVFSFASVSLIHARRGPRKRLAQRHARQLRTSHRDTADTELIKDKVVSILFFINSVSRVPLWLFLSARLFSALILKSVRRERTCLRKQTRHTRCSWPHCYSSNIEPISRGADTVCTSAQGLGATG